MLENAISFSLYRKYCLVPNYLLLLVPGLVNMQMFFLLQITKERKRIEGESERETEKRNVVEIEMAISVVYI